VVYFRSTGCQVFRGTRSGERVSFEVAQGRSSGSSAPTAPGRRRRFNMNQRLPPANLREVLFEGGRSTGCRRTRSATWGSGGPCQVVKPLGRMSVLDNVIAGGVLAREHHHKAREEAAEGRSTSAASWPVKDVLAKALPIAERKSVWRSPGRWPPPRNSPSRRDGRRGLNRPTRGGDRLTGDPGERTTIIIRAHHARDHDHLDRIHASTSGRRSPKGRRRRLRGIRRLIEDLPWGPTMLKVSGIDVSPTGLQVLWDVSFDVADQGDPGPGGCQRAGKSTTAQDDLGALKPRKGSIGVRRRRSINSPRTR